MKLRYVLLLFATMSCGSPPPATTPSSTIAVPAASSSSASPPAPPTTWAMANPAVYAMLDEAELDRRTAAAERRTPGWSVTLDPWGLLSTAMCNVCAGDPFGPLDDAPFTADDRAHVEDFLTKQKGITGLESADTKKVDDGKEGQFRLFQKTPIGIFSAVTVDRALGKPSVSGHAWPRLPDFHRLASTVALETKLRQIDARPGLIFDRALRTYAKDLQGPMELHVSACLARDPKIVMPPSGNPLSPAPMTCLDATSGENITALRLGVAMASSNGKVTQRLLLR